MASFQLLSWFWCSHNTKETNKIQLCFVLPHKKITDIFLWFLFWLVNYLIKTAVNTFYTQFKVYCAESHCLTLMLTHSLSSLSPLESLAPVWPHILVCNLFSSRQFQRPSPSSFPCMGSRQESINKTIRSRHPLKLFLVISQDSRNLLRHCTTAISWPWVGRLSF